MMVGPARLNEDHHNAERRKCRLRKGLDQQVPVDVGVSQQQGSTNSTSDGRRDKHRHVAKQRIHARVWSLSPAEAQKNDQNRQSHNESAWQQYRRPHIVEHYGQDHTPLNQHAVVVGRPDPAPHPRVPIQVVQEWPGDEEEGEEGGEEEIGSLLHLVGARAPRGSDLQAPRLADEEEEVAPDARRGDQHQQRYILGDGSEGDAERGFILVKVEPLQGLGRGVQHGCHGDVDDEPVGVLDGLALRAHLGHPQGHNGYADHEREEGQSGAQDNGHLHLIVSEVVAVAGVHQTSCSYRVVVHGDRVHDVRK